MAFYSTIHLHNVTKGKEAEYASWFDTTHRADLARLRGFKSADRYEVTPEQIMPDIPQPWRYVSVYDFETATPEIDIPALGPLLANVRDQGLIAADTTERIYSYELFGDWKASPNWQRDKPLSGVSIILANYTVGRYDEYQTWYENVHSHEVINVPGHVAMKRGVLSSVQVEPRQYCPGDQVVLCAQQTDNLMFTIRDFSARARGVSPAVSPWSRAHLRHPLHAPCITSKKSAAMHSGPAESRMAVIFLSTTIKPEVRIVSPAQESFECPEQS